MRGWSETGGGDGGGGRNIGRGGGRCIRALCKCRPGPICRARSPSRLRCHLGEGVRAPKGGDG